MTQQIYILDSFETDYKLFVKAANTEQEFIVNFQYYSGATFIANRGKIEITADKGDLSIYDITILPTRIHKGF